MPEHHAHEFAGATPGADVLARTPVPAVLTDADGRIVFTNVAARSVLRLTDLRGQFLYASCLTTDDAKLLATAVASGGVATVELMRGDSSRVEVSAVAIPLTRTTRLVLLRDVSDERRSEAELRYRTALLESQYESAVDGILVVDADSRVVSMNSRFLGMWGVDPELMRVGGSDEAALASVLDRLEDPDEFLAKIEWLSEHPHEATRDEVRFRDGRVFDRWSTPIRGGDGMLYGRGWYFRDITDRKQREAELEAATARLREDEAARVRLVNDVAHDLALPLTAMRVELELLRKTAATQPAQARSIDVFARGIDHLKRLVADLKDVARLDAGQLALDLQDLDLAVVVAETAALLVETAKERGIALETDVQGPLAARVDAARVRQILFNLIGNSLKFTPDGGRVRVVARAEGGEVRVDVTDTGIGLAPEEIEAVFTPFREGRRAVRGERGTGLGLHISRGLAERHGGRLWAESAGRGHGATFHLALPRL